MGNLSEHFSYSEFACRCPNNCITPTVSPELINVLEELRAHFSASVVINSGIRCKDYNQVIGGSYRSQHIQGTAADVYVRGVYADDVADYLEDTYPDEYGIGRYDGRTHIDVRPNKARWDNR